MSGCASPGDELSGEGPTAVVWCCRPRADAVTCRAAHGTMSDDERVRERRYVFEKDRVLYRSTRLLLRKTLAVWLGADAAAIEIASGPHGRPELHGAWARQDLSFNVSHTEGLVVVALLFNPWATPGAAIGVDVEHRRPGFPVMDVASSLFAGEEIAALAALTGQERAGRFVELWSLKESYGKARGDGLAAPFSLVAFDPSTEAVTWAFAPGSEDGRRSWAFRRWWVTAAHVVSVAVRGLPTTDIRVRWVDLSHRFDPTGGSPWATVSRS